MDVTLEEDVKALDEVVVVGYGTMKKRDLVGAVDHINSEALEGRSTPSLTRSLQGQIPWCRFVDRRIIVTTCFGRWSRTFVQPT